MSASGMSAYDVILTREVIVKVKQNITLKNNNKFTNIFVSWEQMSALKSTHRAAASTAVNARTEPSHGGSPLCAPRPISEHHKFHTIQTFGNQTPKQIKRPRLVCNGLVRSAERVTFSILLSTRNEKKVLRPFCYTQNIIPPCATSTHTFFPGRLFVSSSPGVV